MPSSLHINPPPASPTRYASRRLTALLKMISRHTFSSTTWRSCITGSCGTATCKPSVRSSGLRWDTNSPSKRGRAFVWRRRMQDNRTRQAFGRGCRYRASSRVPINAHSNDYCRFTVTCCRLHDMFSLCLTTPRFRLEGGAFYPFPVHPNPAHQACGTRPQGKAIVCSQSRPASSSCMRVCNTRGFHIVSIALNHWVAGSEASFMSGSV